MVLDVDGVVVHLVAVSVDLQSHVFVLEVPMQFVLHGVICFYLLVHLPKERYSAQCFVQRSHLCKHLLHPLLVGLDVLHLPLETVLHLVLDQVDADPSLSVLDTFIIDPGNKEKLIKLQNN